MIRVDVPRLFRVWNNRRFTTDEVAAILKLTRTQLLRLAARYKLPPRHFVYTGDEEQEPPDEVKALHEQRKLECRQRHFEMRRDEAEDSTTSKVSKWRRGICEPRCGRH